MCSMLQEWFALQGKDKNSPSETLAQWNHGMFIYQEYQKYYNISSLYPALNYVLKQIRSEDKSLHKIWPERDKHVTGITCRKDFFNEGSPAHTHAETAGGRGVNVVRRGATIIDLLRRLTQ